MSILSKLSNLYFPLVDFLYILQLEEYSLSRYKKQIFKRILKRNFQKRGSLLVTSRVKLIILVTFLVILAAGVVFLSINQNLLTIFLVLLPLLTPWFIYLAAALISPFIYVVRMIKIKDSKKSFAHTNPDTKIIGITGSYGKTTTKYLLNALLQYQYQVVIIPDNINTTLGIVDYLAKHPVSAQADFLIVEMGAYKIGDVAESAYLLPPDIALLTCLGDQHLERFGSFKNLVIAKSEIFTYSKSSAKKYVCSEDYELLQTYTTDVAGLQIVKNESNESPNVALAKAVALELGVNPDIIATELSDFEPPDRRDSLYTSDGVTVIDNSYNISPQTAEHVLRKAAATAATAHKKLVVMTAGIAEQGSNSVFANKTLGKEISAVASRVILQPSIFMDPLLSGLTIPYTTEEFALPVLNNLPDYIDPETEILLHLPEHGDSVYL